jgi:hypothetical protein
MFACFDLQSGMHNDAVISIETGGLSIIAPKPARYWTPESLEAMGIR